MISVEPVRRAGGTAEPTATLEEVDIRAELRSRPHRPPDYESEDRALAVLARKPVDPDALRTVIDRAASVPQ